MASIETLIFELIARDKNASAAFDSLRRKIDGTTGSVDKNSQALQKNQQAQTSAMGGAVGLGVALSAMSAPLVAAGAGFAAFAGVALPSVTKVKTAMTGPGGLAAAWVTLDRGQRNAALGVQALGRNYSALAKAMEPQVFQVFNQGLHLAGTLLGPVGQLAASAGKGISSFLGEFTANSGIQQFIGFLAKEAGPAIALLGTDITSIAHAAFALLQSFGGLGLAELKAVTVVLTGVTKSISWLATHAPGITSAGIGLAGVALALSKIGLLSKGLAITGLAGLAGQFKGFAAATRGATLAEKGLLATTTALDAISPWAWAAAGVVAVGFLVDKIVTARSSVQDMAAELARQDQATGLNVAGYRKLAAALAGVSANQAEFAKVMDRGRGAQGGQIDVTNALADASRKAAQMASNLTGDFAALGARYGITAGQAKSLIIHSGALNDILKAGGRITPQAAAKMDAYARANERAQGPTSQLAQDMSDFANKTLTAKDRVKALTDALNQFFNPAVTADQDVIALKNDAVSLAAALAASGGKTGLLTQKQRDARGAFDTFISQVATAATSTFDATHKSSDYNKIVREWLPTLYKAAGSNKALRHEVDLLRQTLKGGVTERVFGTGSWSVSGAPGHLLPHHRPSMGAAGMLVRGGIAGRDSVPIMAMPGEVLVPTRMVRAGAVDHLRGRLPGFAAGGVVGSYRGGVPGLSPWVTTMNNQTLLALETAVARATLAGIRAASTAGGGGFGGVGGPGGGVPAMNARLAQLMYGSRMGPGDWAAWNYVAMRESGWNQFARNPSSGAYGIPQALPESKLPFAGQAAGGSNPAAQISWMWNYMAGVYGGPQGAAAHERAFNWYGRGLRNALFTRPTLIGVGDRPEMVNITPAGRGGGRNITVNVYVPESANPVDTARRIAEILNKGAMAGVRLRKSIVSANG